LAEKKIGTCPYGEVRDCRFKLKQYCFVEILDGARADMTCMDAGLEKAALQQALKGEATTTKTAG